MARQRVTDDDSTRREQLGARALAAMEANVAVLDRSGFIVFTNQGWRDFASHNPLPDGRMPQHVDIGTNYLAVCRSATGPFSANAVAIADGMQSVLDGKLKIFRHEYPCDSPSRPRWFQMTVKTIPGTRRREFLVAHIEITDRRVAEMQWQLEKQELVAALSRFRHIVERVCSPLSAVNGGGNPVEVASYGAAAPAHSADSVVNERLRSLSARERQILDALVRGERNSTIADRLHLSRKSVSTYRSRVLEKLHVHTDVELVSLIMASSEGQNYLPKG